MATRVFLVGEHGGDVLRAHGFERLREIAHGFGPGTYGIVEQHQYLGRDDSSSEWGDAIVHPDGRVKLRPADDTDDYLILGES